MVPENNTKETDMRRVWLFVVLALVVGLSSTASANGFLPTEQECREGSDFIKNAVLSRANGYSKAFLLGRFDDDMTVLSGMHPEKRWFVRSQGAMPFLRQALIDESREIRQISFFDPVWRTCRPLHPQICRTTFSINRRKPATFFLCKGTE